MTASPLAVGSVDPASASASTSRISPDIEEEPGVRTSPPAPPEGLFFVSADYPADWFVDGADG